jgi:hypothetical protein
MKSCIIFTLFLFFFLSARAQDPVPPPGVVTKGIVYVAPDSAFSIDFRFRMQNRAIYNAVNFGNPDVTEIEARVRRLRLRMEGFMYSPNLSGPAFIFKR